MYIRTINPVVYNLPISGTAETIVHGQLEVCGESQNFEVLKIKYVYLDPEGNIISAGQKIFTAAEMNALFDEIKADLPNILSTSWDLWRQTQMNTAFMFQMAATFGINVSDIEIVS